MEERRQYWRRCSFGFGDIHEFPNWLSEDFAMEDEEIFTVLDPRFNTITLPLQDVFSFWRDVNYVSLIAKDRDELFRMLPGTDNYHNLFLLRTHDSFYYIASSLFNILHPNAPPAPPPAPPIATPFSHPDMSAGSPTSTFVTAIEPSSSSTTTPTGLASLQPEPRVVTRTRRRTTDMPARCATANSKRHSHVESTSFKSSSRVQKKRPHEDNNESLRRSIRLQQALATQMRGDTGSSSSSPQRVAAAATTATATATAPGHKRKWDREEKEEDDQKRPRPPTTAAPNNHG
ncbi:hypothetical protein VP1G_04350 [Cytospora mali]|uniref:Uncharacterized protein n=1 Tax=Cytospora mali TaxID=578113 RepID=A0A194UZ97_CYTMA|nr:hypothetical protein VP1G_04350 [Valsa mali var. pyri (nom. inval.)]